MPAPLLHDAPEAPLISALRSNARWGPLLLLPLLLPVAAVYAILYRESSSIPIIDDFDDLLDFALQLHHAPTLGRKLSFVLFTQTGDYKLIFEHALVALQLLLLHRISFLMLLWVGNLLLLAALLVLWLNTFPETSHKWERVALFLPVPYLLFQLNFAETLDWALGSLQNIGVVAFGLIALHLLQGSRRTYFLLACCFAVLAASASSNGFALVFAGALILWKRAHLRRLACWVLTFLAFLMVYCVGYHFPQLSPGGASWAGKAVFLLSFLGAAAENMHGHPIHHASVVLGSILLLGVAFAIRGRRLRPAELFGVASLLWILITAAMVANVRISLGMQLALSGRYKIYSDLLLIFTYLLIAGRLRDEDHPQRLHRLQTTALVLSVLLSVSSDVLGQRLLHKRRIGIEAAMRAYQAAPDSASPEYLPSTVPSAWESAEMDHQRLQMTQAAAEKLYVMPRRPGAHGQSADR